MRTNRLRADRTGFGCHRRYFVRETGRRFLSRVLSRLLLSAAVHILRGASVVRSSADVQISTLRPIRWRSWRRSWRAIRERWPAVKIILRGDGVFWPGEANGVVRARGTGIYHRVAAKCAVEETDRAADGASAKQYEETTSACPVVHAKSVPSDTPTPGRRRPRVIAKAEHLDKKEPNPRFVVTFVVCEQRRRKSCMRSTIAPRGGMPRESYQGAAVGT